MLVRLSYSFSSLQVIALAHENRGLRQREVRRVRFMEFREIFARFPAKFHESDVIAEPRGSSRLQILDLAYDEGLGWSAKAPVEAGDENEMGKSKVISLCFWFHYFDEYCCLPACSPSFEVEISMKSIMCVPIEHKLIIMCNMTFG